MIVGVWVLSCLARPIRPWKVMLIVGVQRRIRRFDSLFPLPAHF
jgi:hypothetical protein